MGKDLNKLVVLREGAPVEEFIALIETGNTVLGRVELGEWFSACLEKGFIKDFNCHVELKEKKDNIGLCGGGCNKPANAWVYYWK